MNLDPHQVRDWVAGRLSSKRFEHVVGVVDVAKRLARKAMVCEQRAEIAAWLHDACKEVKDTKLLADARQYGLTITQTEQNTPHLLHGPVAACVACAHFNIDDEELLAAVAEHTLGNVPMTRLSEVVFLADCLEASRPRDYTEAIWNAIDPDGAFDLSAGMLVACDLNISHLIKDGRIIHPKTVQVRNHYLERTRKRQSV